MSGKTKSQQMRAVPRVLVAGLAGAALAVAGTQMQGMFRNPLAEPNVVGVSAGAALGAVVSFVAGLAAQSPLWLPFCAFLGALGALAVVYSITARAGRTPVATLLLAGIAFLSLHACTLEFEAGLIDVLPLAGNPLERDWYVAHLPAVRLPPVASAFRAFLVENGPEEIHRQLESFDGILKRLHQSERRRAKLRGSAQK